MSGLVHERVPAPSGGSAPPPRPWPCSEPLPARAAALPPLRYRGCRGRDALGKNQGTREARGRVTKPTFVLRSDAWGQTAAGKPGSWSCRPDPLMSLLSRGGPRADLRTGWLCGASTERGGWCTTAEQQVDGAFCRAFCGGFF